MNLMQKVEENKKVLASLYRVEQENLYMSMRPICVVGQEVRDSVKGDGVALYSGAHKKPSILSKWFWKGLYGSIFGFKFSKNALEPADSLNFGSKIKIA